MGAFVGEHSSDAASPTRQMEVLLMTITTETTEPAAITLPQQHDIDAAKTSIPGVEIKFSERQAHVVSITPAAAEVLLRLNVKNRKFKTDNFKKLTTDMVNGNFRFTGEPITFDTEGRLLNGQHRLFGAVQTGTTIDVVLVTGVATEAQGDMDAGSRRTLKDTLELSGELYPAILAPILVGIQAWERGERNHDSSGKTTDNTSLAFLAENPVVRDITREAAKVSAKVPGLSAKQVGVFIWAFDKLSATDRTDFFDKLISGAGLPGGNPILTLRNFLHRDAKSAQQVSPYHRMALTVKAWNAYREGVFLGALRFRGGGSNPEAFPEPL
jgi:hypothetical protein